MAARIMVEVPWPWWVTTAGALATALLAALGAWRLRSAAARGALTLLATQCVVTAGIAPFLMPAEDVAMSTVGAAPMEEAVGGMMGGPQPSSTLPFRFAASLLEARAADGSTLALTGTGGWDPAGGLADGGGDYDFADGTGTYERGSWQVMRFVSFVKSAGDNGELKLDVELEGLGRAVLTAGDGFTLVGDAFRFEGGGGFVFTSAERR